jgi:hypothetical protein
MDTYAGSVRVSGGSNMERVQRVEDNMKSSISKNELHKMMHIPIFFAFYAYSIGLYC